MLRTSRNASFTLVELLVALAISALLVTALASISGSTLAIWQKETAYSERRDAAMAVFGQIRRDLRYAELPSDEPGSQFQMVINPTNSVATSYMLPNAAFWQAPSAAVRSSGENAVVGYFVQWTTNYLSTAATPKLCRLMINPSSPDYYIYANQPWVTTSLLTNDAPATFSQSYIGLIANNVLGLWMEPLDQNQQTITTTATGGSFPGVFDSRLGYTCNGRTYPSALPASMRVSIIVVDSQTAQHLTGVVSQKPAVGTNPNSFYSALPLNIRQGAQVYSTVVHLINAPQ